MLVAQVEIHLDPTMRASWFICPNCERRVVLGNAFPLDFRHRVCSKCRLVWGPDSRREFSGTPVEEGGTHQLVVYALDKGRDE